MKDNSDQIDSSAQNDWDYCTYCSYDFWIEDLYKYKCKHLTCRRCLKIFFNNALTENNVWPLECCKEAIDINLAKEVLKKKVFRKLKFKKIQMEAKSFMYCALPFCSAWICLDNISTTNVMCPRCN